MKTAQLISLGMVDDNLVGRSMADSRWTSVSGRSKLSWWVGGGCLLRVGDKSVNLWSVLKRLLVSGILVDGLVFLVSGQLFSNTLVIMVMIQFE